MASRLSRSLRGLSRRSFSSSSTCLSNAPRIGNFTSYAGASERDTAESEARWSSTWYLAAAGFCAVSSATLMNPGFGLCSPSAEVEKDNGQAQSHVRNPRVVFVLGGPGSGKGTQCAKIVENYGFTHLSAGDLLRAEINSGSQYGAMIQNTIKEGKIVPSEVTVGLLQRAMQESGNYKFLIDGFPRNEENRAAFEAVTGIDPEFVLFFDCIEEEMEKRLLNRNQGRADDNIETIRKRFRVFVESSLPVIQEYERRGKVRKINANRTAEEVFKSIQQLFAHFLEEELLQLNAELLHCIDVGDYEVYKKLCDPSLTAFEPEAQGHLVEGLVFHKFFFDLKQHSPSPPTTHSEISSPKVVLTGDDVALVTYTRLCQKMSSDGDASVEAFNETRVWQRKRDTMGVREWKNIHFHRSKSPLHRSYRKPRKDRSHKPKDDPED